MYTFNDGASGRDCIGDYGAGGGVIWTQQVKSDRRYGRKDCTTIVLDINRSGEKENCSLYTKHYGKNGKRCKWRLANILYSGEIWQLKSQQIKG